jgi:hypothetical protein
VAESFGQFTGNTIGEAAAFAAGLAIAPLLEPVLQELRNTSWSQAPDRPLDPNTLAQGVAEGKIDAATATTEASFSGIAQTPFNSLVEIMRNAPGVAAGIDLIRRGQLAPSQFPLVLQRNGLEAEFVTAYQAIGVNGLGPTETPLSAQDVALGMVRNNIRSTDTSGAPIFPAGLDSTGSQVPQHPLPAIDPQAEAAASGYSLDRFTVLANNVGLPPGVIEGLNMLNRGIINEADFALLIEQSDTRIAWGPFILQLRRMLLTPHEAVELRLRNYFTTDQQMYDYTALHGLTPADTDLLFEVTGRPLSWHQVWTGTQRGGSLGGPIDMIDPAFLDSLRKSNVRPEYYNLAWYDRNPVPAVFMVRQWLKDGGDVGQARTWLKDQGWLDPDIDAIVNEYAATPTTTGKTLTRAEIRAGWKAGTISPADTLTRLEAEGLSAADAQLLLNTWSDSKTATSETA